MLREVTHQPPVSVPLQLAQVTLADAVERVLQLPTVADKRFLITIGDRSVTGLVVRDQMVGPWQVAVADCAVTASSFVGHTGEAMAIGERAPLALLDAAAAARMTVAEALTNLAAAPIEALSDIVLSANWMAACGQPGEDAALFDAVRTVGLEFCPALGIAIPVGKDSLSMKATWADKAVTAPLSLIISAFARVSDIRRCLTPQLVPDPDTCLLLVDLGRGQHRLGGSALAQVYQQLGDSAPDVAAADLKAFFLAIQALNRAGKLLAYHDRSDGGLLVTVAEMMFAGHVGVDLQLGAGDPLALLFCEEAGAVLQVRNADAAWVQDYFAQHTPLGADVRRIGTPNQQDQLALYQPNELSDKDKLVFSQTRVALHRHWSHTSYQMQSLRDHPDCAQAEYDNLLDQDDPGLSVQATFQIAAPFVGGARPRVAILREQGVNGQIEMAAAFHHAGFDCVDVHMSDLLAGRVSLRDFQGLAACGGFSYGDVLGAGGGWAHSIRYNLPAFNEFSAFFARSDSFALGVCNGCQMMSQLHDLIPGAQHWPRFLRNRSEQFEARLVMVEVLDSPSIFLTGMAGSQLPVVVAHGEGRAYYEPDAPQRGVALRYIDHQGQATERYPYNPNGSPGGVTGLTTADGRFTIMMPHPERIFLSSRYSWLPAAWREQEAGPWLQLFHNARRWVG